MMKVSVHRRPKRNEGQNVARRLPRLLASRRRKLQSREEKREPHQSLLQQWRLKMMMTVQLRRSLRPPGREVPRGRGGRESLHGPGNNRLQPLSRYGQPDRRLASSLKPHTLQLWAMWATESRRTWSPAPRDPDSRGLELPLRKSLLSNQRYVICLCQFCVKILVSPFLPHSCHCLPCNIQTATRAKKKALSREDRT